MKTKRTIIWDGNNFPPYFLTTVVATIVFLFFFFLNLYVFEGKKGYADKKNDIFSQWVIDFLTC
jgi:hypothetical protein